MPCYVYSASVAGDGMWAVLYVDIPFREGRYGMWISVVRR